MNQERRTLRVLIPADTRWDREVQKSLHEALPYYVPHYTDASFGDNAISVTSRLPLADEKATESVILKLLLDISRSFRDATETKISANLSRGAIVTDDPFPILMSRGEIVSTGHGKFVYRGEFNRAFEGLDRRLRSVCEGFGASSETYPTTVQTKSLQDSGYLKLHPHLAFLAAPIKPDIESLKALSQIDLSDPDGAPEVVKLLDMPEQVLAPTVCYHTFESRRGQSTKSERITALNKCHRHEPVNVQGLTRLTTYWMRELVAFGHDEELQELLDMALEWSKDFLKGLDVSFEVVSANDPFFGSEGAGNRIMQTAFSLKREIKVPVADGQLIAIASFNHHRNSLASKFSISSADDINNVVSSCCVGWGYERLLYAIYSRHGANLASWPNEARAALELA
jgi:hypothetical protein